MAHRFLSFRNQLGTAVCGDVTLILHQCPRLPGMRFVEIEYVPRVKCRVLAESDPEQWRDMTDDECAVTDAALERMRMLAGSVFA